MPTIIQPSIDLEDIPDRVHAVQHRKGGFDPLSPSDIGASEIGHTHLPTQVGAAPASHTHTASQVGAAEAGHTHTAGQVGAAPASHTHTAAEVNASPTDHTHDLADLGAANVNHTHTAGQVGAATADHTHTPEAIGAAAISHSHSASSVGASPEGHTHDLADLGAASASHTHTPEAIGAAATSHSHSAVTTAVAGFMSSADKIKLNSVDAQISSIDLIEYVYDDDISNHFIENSGFYTTEFGVGDIILYQDSIGSIQLCRYTYLSPNSIAECTKVIIPLVSGTTYVGLRTGLTCYVDTESDFYSFSTTGVKIPATANRLGMVKAGPGLSVDPFGMLSITPYFGYDVYASVSSPSSCITYTGQAATMTQTERRDWAYSKVSPSVVKDAEVNYFLQRDDLTKKMDGTAANLDGTDGDVCASFVPLWWSCVQDGKVKHVRLSEYPQAGFVSAHYLSGVLRKWLHLGMFEATGTTCDSKYSVTENPKCSQSLKTFRTQARTKNANLAEAYYNPLTWLSWQLYQALFVFAYGTLDSQTAIGAGCTGKAWNGGVFNGVPVGKADLLTCGGEYISADATEHCMALFVVNPFGNKWQFMDGIIWKDGSIAVATDQADMYDIETGFANHPSSWDVYETGLMNSTSDQYITETLGAQRGIFFPSVAQGGSSATYACDKEYWNTGDRCCLVGGGWYYGALAGLFCCSVNGTPSDSDSDIGSRVQILNAS